MTVTVTHHLSVLHKQCNWADKPHAQPGALNTTALRFAYLAPPAQSRVSMDYSACCNCKKIGVNLTLARPIENYQPRSCDCSFCQLHAVTYISAVDGALSIHPTGALKQLKQGSAQAIFWQCVTCNQIISVTHAFGDGIDQLRGAVNGQLFSRQYQLPAPVSVCPQRLTPADKRKRWLSSWLTVNFDTQHNA